jgi:hypothetical protein
VEVYTDKVFDACGEASGQETRYLVVPTTSDTKLCNALLQLGYSKPEIDAPERGAIVSTPVQNEPNIGINSTISKGSTLA